MRQRFPIKLVQCKKCVMFPLPVFKSIKKTKPISTPLCLRKIHALMRLKLMDGDSGGCALGQVVALCQTSKDIGLTEDDEDE